MQSLFPRMIAIGATCLAMTGPTAVAEVIYDNTDTFQGSRSFTQLQIGDEVDAAPGSRTVIELEIGLSQQGFSGTGDVQAWLYANDGAGARAGTMLWQSTLMEGIEFTGGDDLISFEVPGVVVPDTFTWTVQISNTEPVAVGVPHYGPISIGGSPDWAWFGSPGSWTRLDLADPVDFMARVITDAGCPEDLDGSGAIDFGDILAILAAWGNAGGPEDLDGSGVVDFGDILIVLAAWGPCV